MNKIIGRKTEQEVLTKIVQAKEPAFITIYGRRRIGKTYLIKNFFRDKGLFFHLTGIQNSTTNVQLHNFTIEFSDLFLKGIEIPDPKDWFAAFQMLRKEIEKIPKTLKVIIFFDELPWLSSPRSSFLQALEHLWNRYLSELPNIILIVCGSAASWMIDNVLNNKAGLHGRVTREIRLLPFTLKETEEFLQEKGLSFPRKQILELYMCLGGVAKYLSYLEKGKSVAELIGELCFSYNAPLISEFHKLYNSLFHQHEEHVKIVKALAKSRSGLSYQELVSITKIPTGGALTAKINELRESGFITDVVSYGEKRKNIRYILIDEYSLFYLSWNDGVSALDLQSRGSEYWVKERNKQAWKIWMGHAFESLCLKHIESMKAMLGIAAVQTRASKWRYIAPKHSEESGAEIDLLIDRADDCVHLCEIKFHEEEFCITKDYAERLLRKRECFQRVSGCKKSIFITLITAFGTKHNAHYLSAVDQELTMDALFMK
ncbi:MAG: ATP-binding protein [Chlamydiae bacterium]|nr:ATP-binding protein [Chlamydiota bacterium]